MIETQVRRQSVENVEEGFQRAFRALGHMEGTLSLALSWLCLCMLMTVGFIAYSVYVVWGYQHMLLGSPGAPTSECLYTDIDHQYAPCMHVMLCAQRYTNLRTSGTDSLG